VCTGGKTLECGDDNPCTDDSCDPVLGCRHTNNTAACSDANACTSGDQCSGGTCHGGLPRDCEDGNPCTTNGCDPATGCTRVDNGNACDDGNACTTDDVCGGGLCRAGVPALCDDGNPCTSDSCNPVSGCTYIANGSCDAMPGGRAFYKKLCKTTTGPERLTQEDVACVQGTCTFSDVTSIPQICAILKGAPPKNNCTEAEAYLMSLVLDECRGRADADLSLRSKCTDNTTVGDSLQQADTLLCNQQRNRSDCKLAKCETKEVVRKRLRAPAGEATP
jgi:hypothetical protein